MLIPSYFFLSNHWISKYVNSNHSERKAFSFNKYLKQKKIHLAQGSFSSQRSFVSRAISARVIPSSVNSTELFFSSTL